MLAVAKIGVGAATFTRLFFDHALTSLRADPDPNRPPYQAAFTVRLVATRPASNGFAVCPSFGKRHCFEAKLSFSIKPVAAGWLVASKVVRATVDQVPFWGSQIGGLYPHVARLIQRNPFI